jgi:peptide/nickel transport system substrate-binding protein
MPARLRFLSALTLCVILMAGSACKGNNTSDAGNPLIIASPSQPAEKPTEVPGVVETPVVAPTQTTIPFSPLSISAPDCSYGGIFKSIEALDEATVEFILCKPEVAFLSKVAFPTFGIQSREWLEQTGGGGAGSPLLEKPIGTGPYRVDTWKHGQELVFKAFEDYWGNEKAHLPTLIFRWNMDAEQRLLQLQANMVDGINDVNPVDFSAVQGDPSLALLLRPALNVFYVGMNNTYPPFGKEKVRQALAMGIDRQRLVTVAFPHGYEVASHFTPCVIPNGCVGEPWYEFNPVKARELLAEAGLPGGFQTQLTYRDLATGYLPQPGTVAEEIQAQLWENLNITSTIKTLPSQDFLEAVDAGLPGLYLLGWGADYPDITNFLEPHFSAGATRQFGKAFDDIAEALRGGASLTDEAARRPYYEAANNAIKQHVPMIPISHGGWASLNSLAVAYRKAVEGAYANPFGFENFATLSLPGKDTFMWVQDAEPTSLYCADETNIESLRACAQATETLYRYRNGEAVAQPGLAEVCRPNEDLTVWTCTLRKGIKFHDGSLLDANDVVFNFMVWWDATNPLHKGNSGAFTYFSTLWGAFLNGSSQ